MRRAWPILLLLASCREAHEEAPKATPLAKEEDLSTLVLTEQQVARLQIKTEPVKAGKFERFRNLGGVAIVPGGRHVTVCAPLAGTVGGTLPLPGARLAAGQEILKLAPLLSPESRAQMAASAIEAEGDIQTAKIQIDAAGVALDRAEKLLRDKAGSQRAVDEAKAQRDIALASLRSGESRREVLTTLGPMAVPSPLKGVVLKLHVGVGQPVTAATPLAEIADVNRLWVRVPVYVGEVGTIDAAKEIRVTEPGAAPGAPSRSATPVAAPPSADEDDAAVDLYYEIENKDGALRPGQRVSAILPLRTQEDGLVIAWSAVLHDVQGGTWVYEKIGPLSFKRQRVEVAAVEGDMALLDRGPKPGAEIVVVGAAELFGREFYKK